MTHAASGKSATYGSLATAAAKMPVPDPKSLTLKTRAEYQLLGRRHHGVDDPKIVTGKPLFGIDVQLPGMVYANYTKCPAVGGKVKSFNADEIKTLPGVIDAFVVEGTGKPTEVMPGVAIIAKTPGRRSRPRSSSKSSGTKAKRRRIPPRILGAGEGIAPRASRPSPTAMSAMWTRRSPMPPRSSRPITNIPSPPTPPWSR